MLDDQNVDVTYSESDTKARFGASVRGFASAAELTVSKVTPELVIADHTYVPDELRGRGLAQTLILHLIADARTKGQRIVPLCPFVRAYAQKRQEEVGDVFQW